jgi:UDP-N-acetylglucosamine--N-acetylmuramyl-(pentapeptide) pyrophosphoryl-undecaprenol N-acetylglucosamine transferase
MHAAARRKIPCVIHQLDFSPTLSNRLVAHWCRLITTTFVYHYRKFNARLEEMHIATPNRFAAVDQPERAASAKFFGLDPLRPIVFFVGGGTGARALNLALEKDLDRWLAKIQVIHSTGRGRGGDVGLRPGYARYEFMDEKQMLHAYNAADVVVSRAGMGSITDLSALGKASVLVPIPKSHQEKNARHVPRGAVVVEQGTGFSEELYRAVVKLLVHREDRIRLAQELRHEIKTDDGSEWASLIERLLPEEFDV